MSPRAWAIFIAVSLVLLVVGDFAARPQVAGIVPAAIVVRGAAIGPGVGSYLAAVPF